MIGTLVGIARRVDARVLAFRTVRMRLTALYGVLFLLSGTGLLAVTYLLVAGTSPIDLLEVTPTEVIATHAANGRILPVTARQAQAQLFAQAAQEHTAELQQLLARSGIALSIVAVVSIALGWLMAGRVLRPLRTMTVATQRISEENLHERLGLLGPRDELKDLADTIDSLLTRLEAAFDAQRSFVANASHELRTPLTVARTLLQAQLRERNPDLESFRVTCEEALTAGEQQERLIEALLTLARSQRGLERRTSVDLAEVAADAIDDRRAEALQYGVQFRTALTPAVMSGDHALIERLAANLLENAVRYNLPDGAVGVETATNDRYAILIVTNSGPVVKPEDVERLFKPFQRSGSERTGHGDGLGLGLSIVRAITVAHGAALSARAHPSGGLHIEVRFAAGGRQ
jgi:signal transduction histidine kinase